MRIFVSVNIFILKSVKERYTREPFKLLYFRESFSKLLWQGSFSYQGFNGKIMALKMCMSTDNTS